MAQLTWEELFRQIFPSCLTVASALNRNPEKMALEFLEQQVQAGKLPKRQATEQELRQMEQQILRTWAAGQAPSQGKTDEAP